MDPILAISIFVVAVGAAGTGVFFLAYKWRHRSDTETARN